MTFGPRVIGEAEFARQEREGRHSAAAAFGARVLGEPPAPALEAPPAGTDPVAEGLEAIAAGRLNVEDTLALLRREGVELGAVLVAEEARAAGPRKTVLAALLAEQARREALTAGDGASSVPEQQAPPGTEG